MIRILILCLVFLIPVQVLLAQDLKFKKENGTFTLYEDGQARFTYQQEHKSLNGQYTRANYVHPLYGLDGEILTEDFPEDHPHQRGIFWAWHQIYQGDQRVGNGWLCEGVEWDVIHVSHGINEENEAYLKATVQWKKDSQTEEVLINETTIMTFNRINGDAFSLIFETELSSPNGDVFIGGSEDEKGYGGFSARLVLPEGVVFYDGKGQIRPKNEPLDAGKWVMLEGDFANEGQEKTCITLSGKPELLPHYQGWILREKQSMQNLAFPGNRLIPIPNNPGLKMRHKVTVHRNREVYTEK